MGALRLSTRMPSLLLGLLCVSIGGSSRDDDDRRAGLAGSLITRSGQWRHDWTHQAARQQQARRERASSVTQVWHQQSGDRGSTRKSELAESDIFAKSRGRSKGQMSYKVEPQVIAAVVTHTVRLWHRWPQLLLP